MSTPKRVSVLYREPKLLKERDTVLVNALAYDGFSALP